MDASLNLFETYTSIYENRPQYRTTVGGRRVRWDESDSIDDRVSAMMQKRREDERKKASTQYLQNKGIMPVRKPKQNEEFSDYIDNLQSEGYDLSNWTWDGIEEFYVNEAKKMKGEDPCWKGYEMVGTKKKGGKEVPNCVPKEETEFNEDVNIYDIVLAHLIDEGYAETLEAAEVILENMSDTWIENILEDYKEFPTSKVMKKAGDLMGSSAGKSDEKSKKKEKRGIKMMDVMMQHTPDR